MDIDALHSALLSLTILTEQIRSARDNVSAATEIGRHAFEEFLNSVERDLLITKATLARSPTIRNHVRGSKWIGCFMTRCAAAALARSNEDVLLRAVSPRTSLEIQEKDRGVPGDSRRSGRGRRDPTMGQKK